MGREGGQPRPLSSAAALGMETWPQGPEARLGDNGMPICVPQQALGLRGCHCETRWLKWLCPVKEILTQLDLAEFAKKQLWWHKLFGQELDMSLDDGRASCSRMLES